MPSERITANPASPGRWVGIDLASLPDCTAVAVLRPSRIEAWLVERAGPVVSSMQPVSDCRALVVYANRRRQMV